MKPRSTFSAEPPPSEQAGCRRRPRPVATPRAAALLSIPLLVLLAPAAGSAQDTSAQDTSAQDTEESQADTCAVCHSDVVDTMVRSPHSVLALPAWLEMTGEEGSCSGCHGPVEQHVATDGEAPVYTFGADGWRSDTERCLGCHQKTNPRFMRSDHAKAGLGCTDCHSIHSEMGPETMVMASLRGRPSATCAECHGVVMAEFSFPQGHRLEEGTIECTSCHNPHEPSSRVLLGGFQQQKCAECHVDKSGPFIFEHPVSRVDGCTACHSAHGSPNRHLLDFQRVAESCYSCHVEVPGFHSRFTLDTQCTNCHSQIHGSNLHPAFLQ